MFKIGAWITFLKLLLQKQKHVLEIPPSSGSSSASANVCRSTRRNVQQDLNLQREHRDKTSNFVYCLTSHLRLLLCLALYKIILVIILVYISY